MGNSILNNFKFQSQNSLLFLSKRYESLMSTFFMHREWKDTKKETNWIMTNSFYKTTKYVTPKMDDGMHLNIAVIKQ